MDFYKHPLKLLTAVLKSNNSIIVLHKYNIHVYIFNMFSSRLIKVYDATSKLW